MDWQDLSTIFTEAQSIKRGSKPTALLIGRFHPFHKGHLKISKLALERVGDIVVGLVDGAKTSLNKNRNPFPADLRKKIIIASLQAIYPQFTEDKIKILPNAFIATPINAFREDDYEIEQLWCGEDRGKNYQKMLPYARENLDADMKVMSVSRKDGYESNLIRDAILKGDSEYVKQSLAAGAEPYIAELEHFIKQGAELDG